MAWIGCLAQLINYMQFATTGTAWSIRLPTNLPGY